MIQAVAIGVGVALILFAMPAGLVEMLVASSGVSEAVPAAAPPLGFKARLLLAGFGALMAMGLVWARDRERGTAPSNLQVDGCRTGIQGVNIMGFALSKLSWLSRSRSTRLSRGARPALRRADAHPDAPARAPIYASRDFDGLDIFPRIAPARAALEQAADPQYLPQQPVEDAIDADFEEIAEPIAPDVPRTDHAQHARPSPEPLTLAELAARFERGLAQRTRGARAAASAPDVIADMPIEPAVPVREQVQEDVDEALRAALGTLRAMAGRR